MTDESTIVCIASGPSLTQEDVAFVRGKAAVFVCNDGYKIAPWADLLYAADANWWEYHLPSLKDFKGERWTCDEGISKKYRIKKVLIRNCLHFTNGCAIAGGSNSGFQLLNIAAMRQPKRIVLLGYDMKETPEKSHWFGDHPLKIRRAKPSPYPRFIRAFEQAAPLIEPEIINATRDTALTCFQRKSLQEIFS
jgi:hypothetical protein